MLILCILLVLTMLLCACTGEYRITAVVVLARKTVKPTNGALFYPICPDKEAWSWAQFGENAEAFLEGTYAGEQEQKNIAYSETLLLEKPSWEVMK